MFLSSQVFPTFCSRSLATTQLCVSALGRNPRQLIRVARRGRGLALSFSYSPSIVQQAPVFNTHLSLTPPQNSTPSKPVPRHRVFISIAAEHGFTGGELVY
ncbi:hypothetical protein DFH06DRAFT_1341370 [Mycena polygramma]|nr:hypothetical protein DFH06DRAFT_1341370 [Mycena polygramma]